MQAIGHIFDSDQQLFIDAIASSSDVFGPSVARVPSFTTSANVLKTKNLAMAFRSPDGETFDMT